MNNYLTAKTTITEIEKCWDKNNNRYYKICAKWDTNSRLLYAFSTDFNFPTQTLHTLTNAPENFLNRLVLITYQELPNKDGNGFFYKVKEIELVR